jgi:hypothetical protein
LLAFLDADGTYPPEYFPDLCAEALQGADLVVGSRGSGADSDWVAGLLRGYGSICWRGLYSSFWALR